MAINMFEGARRIAKIAAALWVIGWIVAGVTFSPSPFISVTYLIEGPGKPLARIEADKCNDDGKETLKAKTAKGTEAWVDLCFRSELADDGVRVYAYDNQSFSRWTSPQVLAYTAQVKARFTLPQTDETWIDNQGRLEYIQELGWGAMGAVSGILLLFAFSWAVGWIVRGFMGIPRGADSR